MTSRFAPLLVLAFVLVLPGPSLAFLIDGEPAVIKWSPFHSPEKPPEILTAKPDSKQKTPDTDRQAALVDFLTEDIKEETLFPARIAEIIDSKNKSFLALVAYFLARLHNTQSRPSQNQRNLDPNNLALLQHIKETASHLWKKNKPKSKIIRLDDFRD